MMWHILLVVVAVIGLIALIASTKPDEWTVQRQGAIPGVPAKVFPWVDDLHKFLEWSPWAKLDPAMKVVHGGATHFSWEGNSKVGAGVLTITESRPHDLVRCRIDFSKPFRCTNTHEFALQPDGSQTIVTWTIKGKSPFFFKLILVFVSCDRMMGKDLERGLADLRTLAAG